MKTKITQLFLFLFTTAFYGQVSQAGDIAFVGFNADANDDLAIVTFQDILPNTTIIFCDSEWNGSSFGTDEGDFTWDSGATTIPAGTIITFNAISSALTPSVGSITVNNAGGISSSSEAIFAFLGTPPRTVSTMLAAIANDSGAFGTLDNSGLTLGTTAIVLPNGADVAQYNGPRTGLTQASFLAALNNMNYWDSEDGSGDQSANGSAPDLPFDTTVFTLGTTSYPVVNFDNSISVTQEDAGTVVVSISLSEAAIQDSSIDIELSAGGNATNGNEFSFSDQTVTFLTGESQKDITIILNDNLTSDIDVFFAVSLHNPNNITLGSTTQQLIYILDNEMSAPAGSNTLGVSYLGSYTVDASGSAEIVAHDPGTQRLFVLNATAAKVEILDFSNPSSVSPINSVDMTAYGIGATSIAVKNGMVAATVEAASQGNGKVVFMDTNGTITDVVTVGILPDMLTFTHDGTKVVTANEGEPNDDYTLDPEGTISIIDVSGGLNNIAQANVATLNFNAFDSQIATLKANGIRIFGPGSTVSQDLEPEYITISDDDTTAWVTLQENNALAVVNLTTNQITDIIPLGTKDHSLASNAFDASDNLSAIFMSTWPVKGLYMPDAIAHYTVGGTTYLVTANEGDSRDYNGYSEEVRIKSNSYVLDPSVFPNADLLKKDSNLGRLTVTLASGDTDNDGDFDEIHVYGGRSFSIWNASTGTLVYDSGNDFEYITKEDPTFGNLFNVSNDNNNFKNRSDNKGPEPEGVTVAEINGNHYAFITLERTGGLMVYNITDPNNPFFETYQNSRNTTTLGGDLGPEGIIYIAPADNLSNKGLIVMANEVSATLSIYEMNNVTLSTANFSTTKEQWIAYPNPVKNGTVHFNKIVQKLMVFDTHGRKVLEKENTDFINLDSLSQGFYIITNENTEALKIYKE